MFDPERKWMLGALLVAAGGCADAGDDITRRAELAVAGPWAPPADLVALADGYVIENVQAGPWVGTSGCSGTFTAGGATFRQWVYDHWPQVTQIGGYSCRAIAGTNTMSVHGTGRALDIHIPLDGGQADNELGDPLANWLLEHAQEIGIQSIIWDRWIWTSSRAPGSRSRAYTGVHPHHDHLHIELNPAASRQETPWFQGPMGPPDVGGCDDPLPAEGGVVDDSNPCFQAFGPAQFWRRVDGMGAEGGLRWTNAFESDAPSNWARWRLNLAEGGTYRVEYHSVSAYAVFGSTRYGIKAGAQTEEFVIDQSAGGDGWVTLGEWEFAAGEDQWLAVYDDFAGVVPAEQHVLADAIRLVRPGMDDGGGDDVVIPVDPDPTGVDTTSDPVPVDDIEPDDDDVEDVDPPAFIHAEGGCGCATSGRGAGDALLLLPIVLFGVASRRRRR